MEGISHALMDTSRRPWERGGVTFPCHRSVCLGLREVTGALAVPYKTSRSSLIGTITLEDITSSVL